MYQEYARLDDYLQNTIKVKKFKSLIRMVKRLQPMEDEDEESHEEWVKDHIEGYERTIQRLIERRSLGLKWK